MSENHISTPIPPKFDMDIPIREYFSSVNSEAKAPLANIHRVAKLQPPAANVFSVLMASFREKQAWKEAAIAEKTTTRTTKNGRRTAPFYKILQGMPIAVDAFRYGAIPGVTAYFLTWVQTLFCDLPWSFNLHLRHAHSDHYTNLSSSWNIGPIYCSEGTARLIKYMLRVGQEWIHPLPMDTPVLIPNTGGVHVTLIDANHCPGSCLFYFEGLQTTDAGDSAFKSTHVGTKRVFRYLHCGDFRASPQHVLHPAIRGNQMDHVYLDTTYLDPQYSFPPQPLVISACAELASRIANNRILDEKPSLVQSWVSFRMGNPEVSSSLVVARATNGAKRTLFAVGHVLVLTRLKRVC